MLIAVLITISRMQNTLPQSLLWFRLSVKAQSWMKWGGSVLAPTHLPATYPLILGITALPSASMVEIAEWSPVDFACPWVGTGGGEGRMCGLRQTAQTMSLVTSESSSWLLHLRSPKDDRTPRVPVSLLTKWLLGAVNWETRKTRRYTICRLPSTFPQGMPSLRGRGGRRLESLFENSLLWCNVKLWQELVWFYHFQLIINPCQPPLRNLQRAFVALIKSRLTWALRDLQNWVPAFLFSSPLFAIPTESGLLTPLHT